MDAVPFILHITYIVKNATVFIGLIISKTGLVELTSSTSPVFEIISPMNTVNFKNWTSGVDELDLSSF